MTSSYLVRQSIVVLSPQLAALSVGGAVGFPSILLQQLNANDSSIHLDMNTASWIGSIHGLAGIPSVFMPAIMQWKGRKFAFIIACLVSIIGWIASFTATSSVAILISESFHGLGNSSLLAVSLLSMSEMVTPKFRTMSMVSFPVAQNFGTALLSIIGRYLHWKTVSLIMGTPISLALITGLFWPESPSWLAYKGKFEKCEQAFTWLRGTDEYSKLELNELITAQRELRTPNTNRRQNETSSGILQTYMRKDFYIPSIHMFMLIFLMYWSGSLVIIIYSIDMIKMVTQNENALFFGGMLMNSTMFIFFGISTILLRLYQNKTILLLSTTCTVLSLLCLSVLSYLQTVEIISKDSLICFYFLVVYVVAISFGVLPLVFTVAAELMPVKHKGVGGALFVTYTCVLHASSLKLAPYLFACINLWGTFLLYAINSIVCGVYIWKLIPETKGRTLQELEDYYNGLKA